MNLTITTSLRKLLKGFPSSTKDFRCSMAPIVYGRLKKKKQDEEVIF